MKNYSSVILIFILFLGISKSSAQDLIIKTNGSKIYCRIVEVDSTSIYYFRTAQKNKSVISRAEVQIYYVSKALNKNGKITGDSFLKKEELLILKLVGGLANPTGVFLSKDLEQDNAGFANRGQFLHASLILKCSKYFGLSADYRYQEHSIDNSVLEQAYTASYYNATFAVKSGKWVSKGFYGGLYFNAPIKTINNFSLDFSFLLGLPKFESPKLVVEGTQYGRTSSLIQNTGTTSSPAFIGKIGFNYRLNKVAINFGVGYFTAKPTFSDVFIKYPNGSISYTKFEQKMSSVNVEAGISFLLFR